MNLFLKLSQPQNIFNKSITPYDQLLVNNNLLLCSSIQNKNVDIFDANSGDRVKMLRSQTGNTITTTIVTSDEKNYIVGDKNGQI